MSVPPVEENCSGYAGTATETVIPFARATIRQAANQLMSVFWMFSILSCNTFGLN
jgi:hypothetical protein